MSKDGKMGKRKTDPEDLRPVMFYYLENFDRMVSFIEERYEDLLGEKEAEFLRTFRAFRRGCPRGVQQSGIGRRIEKGRL